MSRVSCSCAKLEENWRAHSLPAERWNSWQHAHSAHTEAAFSIWDKSPTSASQQRENLLFYFSFALDKDTKAERHKFVAGGACTSFVLCPKQRVGFVFPFSSCPEKSRFCKNLKIVCCRSLNVLVKATVICIELGMSCHENVPDGSCVVSRQVVGTAGFQEGILSGHSHSDVSPRRENPSRWIKPTTDIWALLFNLCCMAEEQWWLINKR